MTPHGKVNMDFHVEGWGGAENMPCNVHGCGPPAGPSTYPVSRPRGGPRAYYRHLTVGATNLTSAGLDL